MEMKERVILLAGNPNCGKTTLFNALTGSRQYVGNWPGVTVEKKEAFLEIAGEKYRLVDLPGIYSLSPFSVEEEVARRAIAEEPEAVILNIVDGTNLARNLYLTMELRRQGRPMAVAVNMADELEGREPDYASLARALACPVVPISAKKRQGLNAMLLSLASASATHPKPGIPPAQTYSAISDMLARAGVPGETGNESLSDRFDRVLTGKWTAFPAFAALMSLLFVLAFGPVGSAGTRLIESCVGGLSGRMAAGFAAMHAPGWLESLVIGGVLPGVGGVLAFLPQVLTIFLFLSLLEDSGYMARAAFLTDRVLSRIGLTGRSFIPLLMGYGCTTTAVLGARAVESERDRLLTILLVPFMSCGARLPVYALFTAALFPRGGWAVVAGIYGIGLAAMAAAGALLRRTAFRGGGEPFLMELPPYRMPSLRSVGRRMQMRTRDFLIRAGGVILAMSCMVWFLRSYDFIFRPVGAEESMFAGIGRFLSPLLRPIGLPDWRQGVALLSGLAAKEAVLSTLFVLYAPASCLSAFTGASALSFLVFVALSVPCVSALAVMRRELGSGRLLLLSAALQTGFAYAAALLVYQIGRWFL